MELRQIRSFVAVAEERHFGRAGERLRIAQPAVSLQIRALEHSLGVELFDRGTRPISLTEAGARFLEQARLIVELADRARERVRGVASKRATLKFGASAIGIGPVAEEVLTKARSRFPDLDLQVQLGTTPHNILALNRRALDVVYTYIPFDSPETPRYLPLGINEHVLAIPASHRLASMDWVPREELLNEPFITAKGLNPPAVAHVVRLLFGTSDPPNPVEMTGGLTDRFKLVREGVGIGVVGVPMEALLPVPGVVYRRVADPSPTIEYGLLWFEDHVSPALPAFLKLAREIARKNPAPVNGRFAIRSLVSA